MSIHSAAENNYVQSLIGTNAPTYIRIGAKTDSLGQNSWLDGTPYDYANVGYASMNLGMCWSMALRDDIVPAGKWISSKCDTPVPFICKKKFGVTCGTTAGPTLAPGQCTNPFFYDYSGTVSLFSSASQNNFSFPVLFTKLAIHLCRRAEPVQLRS